MQFFWSVSDNAGRLSASCPKTVSPASLLSHIYHQRPGLGQIPALHPALALNCTDEPQVPEQRLPSGDSAPPHLSLQPTEHPHLVSWHQNLSGVASGTSAHDGTLDDRTPAFQQSRPRHKRT